MEKLYNKKLVKELKDRVKATKNKNIQIEQVTIIKRPKIDEKYVTKENYKELVALYELIKNNENLNLDSVERMLDENPKKFTFLNKCNQYIFDFINELKCKGPYFIAREMSRQGKEIDYINSNIIPNKE